MNGNSALSNVSFGDEYRQKYGYKGIPSAHGGPVSWNKDTANPQTFVLTNKDYAGDRVLSQGAYTRGSVFGGAANPSNPTGS